MTDPWCVVWGPRIQPEVGEPGGNYNNNNHNHNNNGYLERLTRINPERLHIPSQNSVLTKPTHARMRAHTYLSQGNGTEEKGF